MNHRSNGQPFKNRPFPARRSVAEMNHLIRLKNTCRQALAQASRLLSTDIRDLFKREGRLVDDRFLGELLASLTRSGMGHGPAKDICERLENGWRGRVVCMETVWVIPIVLQQSPGVHSNSSATQQRKKMP
jgi:hypothetical protein